MQTKKSKPAKGVTSREFCDVLAIIQDAASSKVAPLLDASQQQQLVWSFDNDRIHEGALAELRLRGLISSSNKAPLPPHSPDMHKVVEHCIGRLTTKVNAELADTEDVQQSVAYWKGRMEEFFFQQISAESIAKDVASLRATYQAIVQVQGAWPAKKHR